MSKLKCISLLAISALFCNLLFQPKAVYASSNSREQISYRAHVMNIGWQEPVKEKSMAGTTGIAHRMEALQIYNNNQDFKIQYKVHVQELGWQDWKEQGQIAGTTGQCLQMEAIQIKLDNLSSTEYTIKYRAHVAEIGWMDWKKDGEVAGTTGRCLRMEAIEIRIEEKGKETLEPPIVEEPHVNNKAKKGIDVSVYQGKIDWSKAKNSIDFVMIRAGFRGYGVSSDGTNGKLVTDSNFRTNINGALNNGIDVGVYFFSQAINEQEAIQEANYVLNLIKGYNVTYPIAIDTEDVPNAVGRADNLTTEQRTKVVAAFCNRIKQAGYEPMIYANKWWLNEQLDMNKLSNYAVWLAHYTGATQDNPFAKPSDYKGKYIMWQYTDKATINGIIGNVDANITMLTK